MLLLLLLFTDTLGAEDILRGDLLAIAGLAWSLIVRYQLSGDGKRPTTKKSVLAWIRTALPNENVTKATGMF